MKKCPHCGFEHAPEVDHLGVATCPRCRNSWQEVEQEQGPVEEMPPVPIVNTGPAGGMDGAAAVHAMLAEKLPDFEQPVDVRELNVDGELPAPELTNVQANLVVQYSAKAQAIDLRARCLQAAIDLLNGNSPEQGFDGTERNTQTVRDIAADFEAWCLREEGLPQ